MLPSSLVLPPRLLNLLLRKEYQAESLHATRYYAVGTKLYPVPDPAKSYKQHNRILFTQEILQSCNGVEKYRVPYKDG